MEKQCNQEYIMIDDKCKNLHNDSFCRGPGEAIFLNAKAEPTCQCRDGWGTQSIEFKQEGPVWLRRKRGVFNNGERCYQEFTPGFCSDNRLVKIFDGRQGCMNNPCGKNSESVPHL